jgi:hypothetical protein
MIEVSEIERVRLLLENSQQITSLAITHAAFHFVPFQFAQDHGFWRGNRERAITCL